MFLVHIRISCYISSEYVGFGDNFSDLNFRFTERPYVRKFETIFLKYVTQFDREQSPVNIRKYKCLVWTFGEELETCLFFAVCIANKI